ncbi:EAL domain-containing protein [Ruminococcus sp.]|uniref:EAL domain-containing protein n=1 Tax=Ruminococcus sp. TaxID=41978 RepID=UPI0025ECB647|nr:EAL domain-containing protein [Ruminococcus sp.]
MVYSSFFEGNFIAAVNNGYIKAFFQPMFRSMTGKMVCVESLARWIDPEKGIIAPNFFVPALENSGLIFDLDMEILRQACALYQEFEQRGKTLHSISVNLSRLDFRNDYFYDRVVGILAKYNVPHNVIKLEITESLMLEDVDSFQVILNKLNDAGFSIWMDDFGSGYSSLNVLKNYNFDLMKFDMLFLRDFSIKGRRLFASMINMAKSLGIQTLAEGVETKEQREFLTAAGCEILQGFYYSKPVPKDELIKMIDSGDVLIEHIDDKEYWERIGQLNLLSANPLKDYVQSEVSGSRMEFDFCGVGAPISLIECTENNTHYIYASESYKKNIRALGYSSIDELEQGVNNYHSDQYILIKKLFDDAISSGTIRDFEYVRNEVYYKLSVKCLARKKDSAMLAVYINTFDSEAELNTAKEMLFYSNSLFSTYELVVIMYPEQKNVMQSIQRNTASRHRRCCQHWTKSVISLWYSIFYLLISVTIP